MSEAAENKKQSAWHWFLVIMVFAVTGTTASIFPKWIMPLTGVEKGTAAYVLVYILMITSIYQVLLLGYAWVFGKYGYFLEKQKKLWQRIDSAKQAGGKQSPSSF